MERLVINRTNLNPITGAVLYDSVGAPMGEGTYTIKGSADLFDKTILFRPIVSAYKYFAFNAKEHKYEGETVYVYGKWNDNSNKYETNEPIDNLGTVMLGRPPKDELEAMDPIMQDYWRKKARWQMCLFGLADFAGSAESILCEFTYSGRTGVEILDVLNKQKKPWYDTKYHMSTTKLGEIIKPVLKKFKTDNEDVQDAVKETYTYLDNYNAKIAEYHKQAIAARSLPPQKPIVKTAKKSSEDLDSHIPF
mgnify:CR=1 FL=1